MTTPYINSPSLPFFSIAESLKSQGNIHFKSKKYSLALNQYTHGITTLLDNLQLFFAAAFPNEPKPFSQLQIFKTLEKCTTVGPLQAIRVLLATLLSNRVSCYLKLKQYNLALQDCAMALEMLVMWTHDLTESWNLILDTESNPIYRKIRAKMALVFREIKNPPQAIRNLLKADSDAVTISKDSIEEYMMATVMTYSTPFKRGDKRMDHSLFVNGAWERLNLKGSWFSPRCFHTCTKISDSQCVVYAGMHPGTWIFCDDMYLLDFSQMTIEKINYRRASKPRERKGHTTVFYDGFLWVLGGESSFASGSIGDDPMELFCQFNLERRTWKSIRVPSFVKVRLDHTALVYEDAMWVFGGNVEVSSGAKDCNDLYRYTFNTDTWEKVEGKGRKPSKRSLHTAWILKDRMYISHGTADNELTGCNIEDCYCFNDTWSFDFKTHEWVRCVKSGNICSVRSEFSSTVIGADTNTPRAVVYGGYASTANLTENRIDPSKSHASNVMYMDDAFEFAAERPKEELPAQRNELFASVKHSWRMVLVDANMRPSRRAAAPLVTMKDTEGNEFIVLVGGYYGMLTPHGFADTWKLSLNLDEARGVSSTPEVEELDSHKENAPEESPLAAKVKGSDSLPVTEPKKTKACFNCGTTEGHLKRCPCGLERYCSKQCQAERWRDHKQEHYKVINK